MRSYPVIAVKLQGGQKGTDLPIFKHQCNSKYGIPGLSNKSQAYQINNLCSLKSEMNTSATLITHYNTVQFRRFKRKPKFLIFFLLNLGLVPRRYRYSNEGLSLTNGPTLFKLNIIPNLKLVQWVMSLVLLLLPNPTFVLWVRSKTSNFNRNSFVVCGADDSALH
ncbi:hypothetical protein H5410_018961 [Solanum commersonii]|uniref:Uncharacterized protein n=1 Tax=Solanum commersonii TaxID=4109 RepID=A0A9J6A3M3_SOLCO|nr:hypothetical protein H5410_018961 [Solanum commersonii]